MTEFIPAHRFMPLQEVVLQRSALRKEIEGISLVQRAAYSVFVGHRKSWVEILPDGAGDGYFYDPNRKDDEGAFFFHFAEEGRYLWFPSFRNFLAGVIEAHETGVYGRGTNSTLVEDYNRTQQLWSRFGIDRNEQSP